MTLERLINAQNHSLNGEELTSWWSETASELEGKSCLVVYADDVNRGRDTVTLDPIDISSRDIVAMVERLSAQMVIVSASVATDESIQQALERAGDEQPKDMTRRLKTLRSKAPLLTSIDILLLTQAGLRVGIGVTSTDEEVVFGDVFDRPDLDEDDLPASYRRESISEERILEVLNPLRTRILETEQRLCSRDPFEVRSAVVAYLKDALPEIGAYEVPRSFVASLRSETAARHERELMAMGDELVPELFALVPPEEVAITNVGGLVSTAREVQRKHHECATAETAKTLVRKAKAVAKHANSPRLL